LFSIGTRTNLLQQQQQGGVALSAAVLPSFIRMLATFGQIILPVVFLFGAIVSAFNSYKRKKLYIDTVESPSSNPLDGMNWRDFELLVGEHFRREGFVVEETAGGADGGVDLIAMKNGEKYLIQCKQWKAYKVGVKVVRELLGVMVGDAATGGFVVTSGNFTRDAVIFAKDNNITLLDGKSLQRMMKAQPRLSDTIEIPGPILKPSAMNQISCKECGAELVLRTAKKGRSQGKQFYGCTRFPKCRYTKAI